MKISVLYLMILGIILVSSCKTQELILGRYYVNNNLEYFELKNDSTFDYYYRYEWFHRYSKGNWIFDKEKQEIQLISNILDPLNIPISVQAANEENSSIRFYFPNLDNQYKSDVIKWEIYIDNKPYPIKIEDGNYTTIKEKIKIDNFYLQASANNKDWFSSPPYSKIKSSVYNVKDTTLNYFEVRFPEKITIDIFNYKPIHELMQIKGKTFIWSRTGDDGKVYKVKYKVK